MGGEEAIVAGGCTEVRPSAAGCEAMLGRGGPGFVLGRGACEGDCATEFAVALGANESLFGGSGLTDGAAAPGGIEPDRDDPSSNIAAMRAAFVAEGGSTGAEGEGGIEDPPFFSRAGDLDRGFDIGVPSGARRTT
jgi:hypothetical protein